ncbi:MAG: hypothetical protein ABJF11_03085 [Reichenbachiella sp.]|uniref:hypothetical protein n=1 Tax=Reichenbachiella sp. TaxID=2184521 RepID=UPI003265373E
MNKVIKHLFLQSIFTFPMLVASAQTESEVSGEVQDAEVVIEKERKIELPQETKVYEFIKWSPEVEQAEGIPAEYRWFDYPMRTVLVDSISANVVSEESLIDYQNFGRAGIGNYGSPLFDLSLTNAFDANTIVGANVKHKSFSKGEVDEENSASASSEVSIWGALMNDQFSINSALGYQSERSYYYGYPEGTIVSNSEIKHSSNFVNFDIQLDDSFLKDDWGYYANTGFRHYSDNFEASENTLLIQGGLDYLEKFFLDTDMAFSSYSDIGIDVTRSFVRLNPYYRIVLSDLTLDVGLSASLQNDDVPDLAGSRFLPYLNAKYQLNDSYYAFAKLDGGFTFNSLYETAKDINMLNQSTVIVNSDRLIDLSAGIAGRPIDQLSFKLTTGYKVVNYLPVLINNVTDQSRIDVFYASENTDILWAEGEALYKINEAHEFAVRLGAYNYSSSSFDQIYHRPTTSISLSGSHDVFPKFNASWYFSYLGGLKADGRLTTDADISLDPITQLELRLHYQLKEQWGAFLSGENLFGQQFERYLYYTQRGVQIKGGITFKF